MRKLLMILLFGLVALLWGMVDLSSAELTKDKENVIYFRNNENLFDNNGMYVEPGSRQIIVGDHIVGIISIQHINVGGTITWFQSATDQISGIFAQRVYAIVFPDTFDPIGAQTLPHLVLGPPTVTTFKGPDGTTVNVSGMLSGNEMLALYHQTGAGTTTYEFNGTMADDVAKATDGTLWLTLGYTSGLNSVYGDGDDDGYSYSHVTLTGPLANFTGESWAQLNAIRNNTGYSFAGINDPNENEIGPLSLLLNDIYLSSELELEPFSKFLFGPGGKLTTDQGGTLQPNLSAISPWDIRSEDPAHIIPIEQIMPGECRVTAGGNKDRPCVTENWGSTPIIKTCANDDMGGKNVAITHTWGGQAGAQPRIDCNWTHHYKADEGTFGFHSRACYYINCSDTGEQCKAADGNPETRQIDFAGIGKFTHKNGAYSGFPNHNLCFEVHLEDIGEPGRGGSTTSGIYCEHCPGNMIINYDPVTGRNDCEDCTDHYEIRIYDSSAIIADKTRCEGNLLWTNGPLVSHPNCATDTAGLPADPSPWITYPRSS